ncbi:MAG: glycosyltransferase family 4 protein, partial [Armatimonadetes bacterium]|nr:glycosyltransferase family 4 protein [Armatimonadota bacterium]
VEPPRREPRTQPINILYLGRLIDLKGPDLVIRAFEIACSRGMDAQLVIAGDGPLRTMCELLRARSRFRERITLLGAVDAQTGERLRTEADIFTAHNCFGPLTLHEEAFGVSFVEAMAAGLPVVSGRSGSLPELIADGRDGLLVEPGDVEAHAGAFLRLASDPGLRQSMGEAGWRKAKHRFSCERERAQLRAILGLDGDGGTDKSPSSQRES